MEASPPIVKATLVPVDGDTDLVSDAVTVHFNPTSLRLQIQNTLRADTTGGGNRSTAAQHVESSSSSLAIELLFDTTVATGGDAAGSDVRSKLKLIVERFIKPDGDRPPKRCRFQWGQNFSFVGMITTYSETLDFFSPEGVPLRASLSLSLVEDRFEYPEPGGGTPQRRRPRFTRAAPDQPLAGALPAAGAAPSDWRAHALANGIENPRMPGVEGLALPPPGVPVGAPGGAGGAFSLALGGGIPGAFPLRSG
jgi:hypothetical protein